MSSYHGFQERSESQQIYLHLLICCCTLCLAFQTLSALTLLLGARLSDNQPLNEEPKRPPTILGLGPRPDQIFTPPSKRSIRIKALPIL